MRRVLKYPLPFNLREGDPRVIDRVERAMPAGAQIVHFDVQFSDPLHGARTGTPTVWALVDDQAQPEQRRFQVFGTGQAVPPGAQHVGSYLADPFVWHVFELAEEMPADLPAEMYCHWRTLTADGWQYVGDERGHFGWRPPADFWTEREPTAEQVIALASLDEHGYGDLARPDA